MRLMRFRESEVQTLTLIAGSEKALHPRDLSRTLNLRSETLSRVTTTLVNKGLLEREGKEIALGRNPAAESFKRLYFAHRASPFPILIADRRVDLLSKIENKQKRVEVLEEETAIPRKTIYRYLKGFLHLGVVKRSKKGRAFLFSFNYIIWKDLKDFVTTLIEYQALRLVPREGLLTKSYENSVLFKSLRSQDATPTSFSAYENYGIELVLRDNYYTLPKRKLPIQEIFIHSLDSAQELSQRLFCILFYLKNKNELEGVDHIMMKSILAVLRGEQIKGYPTLEDIKDRTELYGIEF